MASTFSPGQVLYVRPATDEIQPGDVVVYHQGDGYVVHRVTAIHAEGYKTRGDNNPFEDAELIPKDKIIGVVYGLDDWGKMQPVAGGKAALIKAKLGWKATANFERSKPILGAPYRWLKKKDWVRRFWHPNILRVNFRTSAGIIVKYIIKGKTVATWIPKENRFFCRRPYDLIVFPPKAQEN